VWNASESILETLLHNVLKVKKLYEIDSITAEKHMFIRKKNNYILE